MQDKPTIQIKPENRGSFTSYCKRKGFKKVTGECIRQALKSKSKAVRKKALFARNARMWRNSK